MDELELQEAMEIALTISEHGTYAAEPSKDVQLAKLAAAVIKLGGNTIRPRTRTVKGLSPIKP
jgi:hypothetical protein